MSLRSTNPKARDIYARPNFGFCFLAHSQLQCAPFAPRRGLRRSFFIARLVLPFGCGAYSRAHLDVASSLAKNVIISDSTKCCELQDTSPNLGVFNHWAKVFFLKVNSVGHPVSSTLPIPNVL